MISLIIKLMTIEFVFISICTIEKKKSVIKRILDSINKSYLEFVNQQGSVMRFLLKFSGIILLIVFYIISFEHCCLMNDKNISMINIVFSVFVWIIASLIMYFGFGCVLAIFSKTLELIGNVKDSKIGIKMMCSFALVSFLMTV